MTTKCPDCGFDVPFDRHSCPECGCPIDHQHPLNTTDESKLVEDSAPQPINQEPQKTFNSVTTTIDYNESPRHYSPFEEDSWFFRAPAILKRYPVGELGKKHPFWGWLFGPWHITRDVENEQAFNSLNNFFYLCNLLFKAIIYPCIWVFFKMWWVYLLYLGGVFILSFSDSDFDILFTLLSLLLFAINIVALITYFCGWSASLHRYWPRIYNTFYRMTKRFCLTNRHAIQNNSLDV